MLVEPCWGAPYRAYCLVQAYRFASPADLRSSVRRLTNRLSPLDQAADGEVARLSRPTPRFTSTAARQTAFFDVHHNEFTICAAGRPVTLHFFIHSRSAGKSFQPSMAWAK